MIREHSASEFVAARDLLISAVCDHVDVAGLITDRLLAAGEVEGSVQHDAQVRVADLVNLFGIDTRRKRPGDFGSLVFVDDVELDTAIGEKCRRFLSVVIVAVS